jgi:ATP-dependent DNA helicase RecG
MACLKETPLSASEIALALGQKSRGGQLKNELRRLLADLYIEYTIPDKPNSRLQKYRLSRDSRRLIENPNEGKK